MATDEQILYRHFLEQNKKRRAEAVELLKQRNFSELRRNYAQWIDYSEKTRKLHGSLISSVITELQKVKTKANETEPCLYSYASNEDSEQILMLSSWVFRIEPVSRCVSLAKHYTKDALWKLEHQPNGKDAKGYEEILKRHSRKN